ncbi:MFS transporter [Hydrocarboniphaga effusa]|uniref:MFS transporter n=1 Tax=Hydrocarboniphaga effusa TaxID=243629 RepID=UPI0035B2DE79
MSSADGGPAATAAAPAVQITPRLTLVFAIAVGAIVANLYYVQPLIEPIGSALQLSPSALGLMVTLAQIGYALGLLLLVPLGDLLENRRLCCSLLLVCAVALIATASAQNALMLLGALLAVGLTSVVAQVLVPFASQLAPDATRGRVVGNIMSGLFIGILLARPLSSALSDIVGWRAVFAGSAVGMLVIAAALRLLLPARKPSAALHYLDLLRSLWQLWRDTPLLRRRALYHAGLFGGFSLYWTGVTLVMTAAPFHLSHAQFALFALAGIAGAIASPIAGRAADRGWAGRTTAVAMLLVSLGFACAAVGAISGSLALMVISGIVVDLGVSANLVTGQRLLFALNPAARSRMNALYMATFFCGGAIGSAITGVVFAHGGWLLACAVGAGAALLVLAAFATEKRAA